jgi:DHA3 family tetracycline resistance protein-like MFS transporter
VSQETQPPGRVLRTRYGSVKQLLEPFSQRDFRRLWIGQAISSCGNAFQSIALPWLVFDWKGTTALDLALALLAQSIPQALATLWGGVLVDRLEIRVVMLWADSVRFLTSLALAGLAFSTREHLWLVCSVLLIHGAANGCFAPATTSAPPRLVDPTNLSSANALIAGMAQLGPLLGALPAGVLIASSGPAPAFALNAASFLLAVLATRGMRPLPHASRAQKRSALSDLRAGQRYLRRLPWLIVLLVMDSLLALAAIATNSIGLPLLAKQWRAGPQGYSALVWSYGTGALLGFLLPSLLTFPGKRGAWYIGGQATEALLIAVSGFVPLPFSACCLFAWSAINGMIVVMTMTLLQQKTAADMLGRVMSFWMWASTGTLPLAIVGGGVAAQTIGSRGLFALAGAIVMVGALLGLGAPAFRRLP